MATIDIREEQDLVVEGIVFADGEAYRVTKFGSAAAIDDDCGDYVVITNKEHAQNLIKALEKAIELGWLK